MKKTSLFIFCFISICTFFGCKKNNTSFHGLFFESTERQDCHIMDYSDLIGNPVQLLMNGNCLFINDFMGDSLLTVYDLKNKEIVRRLVSKGNGPGEMTSPLEVQFYKNNLNVYTRSMFTLYSTNMDAINEKRIPYTKVLNTSTRANRIYQIEENRFILSGLFEKRYKVIDASGNELYEFGEFPRFWTNEKDFPSDALAMFHQCSFIKHPSKNRIVSRSSHVLEIFDYDLVRDTVVPVVTFPVGSYSYTFTAGNSISATRENRVERGMKDVFGSEQYIYVLYDPSSKENNKDESVILVFDWEGKPVRMIELPCKIENFTIDEDAKVGYCLMQAPDYELGYFNI